MNAEGGVIYAVTGNRKQGKRRRRSRGFTLIELLVVLVILGLVAAIAVPQVIKYVGSAKSDTARIQIGRLATTLDRLVESGSRSGDSPAAPNVSDATTNGPGRRSHSTRRS